MTQGPQLVWHNPSPPTSAHINTRTLASLAETLVEKVREGQLQVARSLVAFYRLSPIAMGFVAVKMARAGVSKKVVLSLI